MASSQTAKLERALEAGDHYGALQLYRTVIKRYGVLLKVIFDCSRMGDIISKQCVDILPRAGKSTQNLTARPGIYL